MYFLESFLVVCWCIVFVFGHSHGNGGGREKLGHKQLIQKLASIEAKQSALETKQKGDAIKINQLETLIRRQSGIIKGQSEKIKIIEEAFSRRTAALGHALRTSRANRRKLSILEDLLVNKGLMKNTHSGHHGQKSSQNPNFSHNFNRKHTTLSDSERDRIDSKDNWKHIDHSHSNPHHHNGHTHSSLKSHNHSQSNSHHKKPNANGHNVPSGGRSHQHSHNKDHQKHTATGQHEDILSLSGDAKHNGGHSSTDKHSMANHERNHTSNAGHRSNTRTHQHNMNNVQTANDQTRHGTLQAKRSSRISRQQFGGIAFSVYLDHDATLGQHEAVKFNKVITNEGSGYNSQTGVFTCEEGGVYMFTLFIGQRNKDHYMWAELMVNSRNVIDAVVDTYHEYQDLQGGNTVILRLNPGDRVWVDATHSGSHVEGAGTLRLTTFSGLLLYP